MLQAELYAGCVDPQRVALPSTVTVRLQVTGAEFASVSSFGVPLEDVRFHFQGHFELVSFAACRLELGDPGPLYFDGEGGYYTEQYRLEQSEHRERMTVSGSRRRPQVWKLSEQVRPLPPEVVIPLDDALQIFWGELSILNFVRERLFAGDPGPLLMAPNQYWTDLSELERGQREVTP